MMKFIFSDKDIKYELTDDFDADCVYGNVEMSWRGEGGDIIQTLDRFKSFLRAMTFCEQNIERIVYLSEEQYNLMKAKDLLEGGDGEVQS